MYVGTDFRFVVMPPIRITISHFRGLSIWVSVPKKGENLSKTSKETIACPERVSKILYEEKQEQVHGSFYFF